MDNKQNNSVCLVTRRFNMVLEEMQTRWAREGAEGLSLVQAVHSSAGHVMPSDLHSGESVE